MADIHSAVLWWDEWQLRILVLSSLGVQWFLVLVAPMRKYTIPGWFRKCIWLAYISSDALAIYALATLFNRHARGSSPCQYEGVASSLEVLWAPLLLVHLGGREEITAYSIEDNELWTRHTVTLVSQVTVALYAFYKSWPSDGDGRLLLSAILLFITGVINFCEKPWALRSASINRLVAMSSIMEGQRRRPKGWECCFSELDDRYKCWKEMPPQESKPILSEMDKVQMILSDMSLLAVQKEQGEHILVKLDPSMEMPMRRWLRRAFELIYTRANAVDTPAYLACNLLMVPSLYVAAITLFSMSRKQAYSVTDVKMTYILMCFTAVLDVFGVLISKLVNKLMIRGEFPALCETLPGYNLINSVLRRMKPATGWLLICATRFGYKVDYFSSGRDKLHRKVSEFVISTLMSHSSNVDGLDPGSYRCLTKSWVLGQKSLTGFLHLDDNLINIRRSLRDLPFDQSVLVWHIATDLYFRINPPNGLRCRPPHPELLRELCTETISNYMVHLLNFRPEMLMTGSRKHLFTKATSSLEKLLRKNVENKGQSCDNDRSIKHVIEKIEEGQESESVLKEIMNEGEKEENKDTYPIIHDACKLAKELMQLPDDEKRQELMYHVWVGMLCYSASMCRGYLHAKSLGEGGEFLSYFWLVISLKGFKTLADKLQMSEEVNTANEPRKPEAPTMETSTSKPKDLRKYRHGP